MKVAVCICVYNETNLLKAALKQFPAWIDKILVLVSEEPWFGMKSDTEMQTVEILKNCKDERLEFVKMKWLREHDQRNWGIGKLSDYDWVLTLDADEYFTPQGWDNLCKEMKDWNQVDVITANMRTYWKTDNWRWEPEDLHKPTIAVRPKRVAFWDKREVTINLNRISGSMMYHFSWVRTDAEVKQKIQNYMHAKDFDGDKWYQEVWLKWSPEMKGIRPYGNDETVKAIYNPAPDEVKAYFL